MLTQIALVALGSLAGGILRFLGFYFLPFGILCNLLIINLIGSFSIGYFSQIFLSDQQRLIVIVGFLGSFSTFSSLSFELFSLLDQNKIFLALTYSLASICLGILAVWCGMLVARF